MTIKQGRMADRIRQILSELIRRETSDPRLKGVTVTEVTLDREMMFANVYVNALGDENRQPEVMQSLKRAAGFLRRETGKRIRLRNTPELIFHWDTTLERGEYLNQLADQLDIPADDSDAAVDDLDADFDAEDDFTDDDDN
jgi:ribosome-binding factor A